MKLRILAISSFFPVLTLPLLPVFSRAASTNDPIMQECIHSQHHLIKKGNNYFVCASSKLNDISSADTASETQARAVLTKALQKKEISQNNVKIIKRWQNPDPAHSVHWTLLVYAPASQTEAKKLDDFIASKGKQPPPNSGIDHQQLAQNVSGATSGVAKAFKSPANGATPNPSSPQGMGNLSPQAQGQSNSSSPSPLISPTNSSPAAKTPPTQNSQNTDQLPLLPKTKAPPATPPAPTTNKPKKSKPGFFAKIWNGIKKVGHYIISSRIGTGLMLGLAAGLMVTGFGAAPGVIIAAAVLGAGIGLAAGPLSKSSASKALPPPPPIASSPTNSQNPNPTPTAPSPNPSAATTPPEGNINLNTSGTMNKANDIAKQLNQNKPTENDTVSGPAAAAVTARNTTQNSQASKLRATAHPKNPGQHSKTSSVPSSPNKSAKAKASKVPIPIAKSAVEGAVIGGSAGWALAAAGIISAPVWASAALGVAAGAAVAAAGVAAWNYFKNKPTPAKPKAKPQKNQNPGNTPKTQALPKPPIPGPQEM